LFSNEDEQVGFEFLKTRACIDCYDLMMKSCDDLGGSCVLVEEYVFDGYVGCTKVFVPTGKFSCINCGF
jgi:hypothetical protein